MKAVLAQAHTFCKKSLVVLTLWLLCGVACAAPLLLSGVSAQANIGNQLVYIRDAGGELSFADVSAADADVTWKAVQANTPNFGFVDDPFWYKLTLVNDTTDTAEKILEIAYPPLDDVRFYRVDQNGELISESIAGDTLPFSIREVYHRNFIYPLRLPPGAQQTLYLRIYTQGPQQVPITLWQPEHFYREDEQATTIKAYYFGMISVMVFYNFFLWLSLRERPHLYYVLFQASFLLTWASIHGFTYQYFWPDAPWLNSHSITFLGPLSGALISLFAISLMDLARNAPWLYRYTLFFVYLNALNCLLSLFATYATSMTVTALISVPQMLGLLICGPLMWRRGIKVAKIFTIALTTLYLGAIANVLGSSSYLPVNFITEHGVLVGSALEALLLSFALADRIASEKEARFQAQSEQLLETKQRRKLEREMLHKATHSARSLLPNRVLFLDALQRHIDRPDDHTTAAALVHLKRFHEINKTFGHQNGNQLLRLLAQRLNQQAAQGTHFSPIEHSPEPTYLAAVEGISFGLILHAPDAPAARQSLAILAQEAERAIEFNGMALDIGFSIGMAAYPEHGDDAETLLQHAQIAIDTADRAEDHIAVYSQGMNLLSKRRLALMGDLNKAIKADALELHFQPQIDPTQKRVKAVEALLRWQHPEHGFIPPDEFIPLAEQTGVIKSLTRWVIDKALAMQVSLKQAGFDLRMAVNISALNLREPDLVSTIQALVKQQGVGAHELSLEVTESAMMADATLAMEALEALHAAGFRLAIDDFGTGYSSLAYVKQLPVDEIKIDRSFVMDMDKDPGDALIVNTTVTMCHNLGYEVVAEGVETQATCEQLHAIGCDSIQGYYLSKPLPAAALLSWLEDGQWQTLLPE